MNSPILILGLLLSVAYAGCLDSVGIKKAPLPMDKQYLAGCWQAGGKMIWIADSGSGKYYEPGYRLQAPLSFNASKMSIGLFGVGKTFEVGGTLPADSAGKKAISLNGQRFAEFDCFNFPADTPSSSSSRRS